MRLELETGKKKLLILAPRGLGKTTTVVFKVLARRILFRMSKYIVYVSNTATNAELQTENLKYGLQASDQVNQLFPPVQFSDNEDKKQQFSKQSWIANGHTLVLPRGAGQQIRGLNFRGNRPDFFVFDDLEDTESVRSEEQRLKLKKWFYADAMRCVSPYKDDWRMLYIDTLKHEDALVTHLKDSNEWDVVELQACDENFNPTAPEYYTREELVAEFDRLNSLGIPEVFHQEFRNKTTGVGNQAFSASDFRYFTEEQQTILSYTAKAGKLAKVGSLEIKELPEDEKFSNMEPLQALKSVVIIDPAKTLNPTAADSAVVGVSISTETSSCYVRRLIAERIMPDELYQTAFNLCDELSASILAVEVTSLNNFITQPLRTEAMRRGFNGDICELKAVGKKEERIRTLIPMYRRHQIYHPLRDSEKLEGQLLSFPYSRLLDLMDALAYLPKLLLEYKVVFSHGDPVYQTQITPHNPVNSTQTLQPLEILYGRDSNQTLRGALGVDARDRFESYLSQFWRTASNN